MIKYSELSLGQIEAIVNRIGGMQGVDRLLANELVMVERSTLKPVPTDSSSFPTWKVLKLDRHDNVTGLRELLKSAGNNVSDYGDDLLGRMPLAKEAVELELVVASVKELGLKSGATTKQIYDRASELGLDLCPAQVGPQLRLAYQDQPKGEWLLVAMEQITDRVGSLSVFSVERDGDGSRWLFGFFALPGDTWDDGGRWVFVRRKH